MTVSSSNSRDLMKAAELFAAGKTLGLDIDETMELVEGKQADFERDTLRKQLERKSKLNQQRRDARIRRRSERAPTSDEQIAMAAGLDELGLSEENFRGQDDIDLMRDRFSETYGEDQSGFQNATSEDKNFASNRKRNGEEDINIVNFYDPVSKEYRGIDVTDTETISRLTSDQVMAVERAIEDKARSVRSQVRPMPKDRATKTTVRSDPRFPAGDAVFAGSRKREGGRDQYVIVDRNGKQSQQMSYGEAKQARQRGQMIRPVMDRRSRASEDSALRTAAGDRSTRTALAQLEAKVASGELSLDSPLPGQRAIKSTETAPGQSRIIERQKDSDPTKRPKQSIFGRTQGTQTVGDLIARLRANTPEGAARADRSAGAAAVQENRRIASGNLTEAEIQREARRRVAKDQAANDVIGNSQEFEDPQRRGTLPGGFSAVKDEVAARVAVADQLRASLGPVQAEQVARRRSGNDMLNAIEAGAFAEERAEARARLDAVPRLTGGKSVYQEDRPISQNDLVEFDDSGYAAQDAADRATTLYEVGDDGRYQNNMKRMKLTDYRPDTKVYAADLPEATSGFLGDYHVYQDAVGNVIGDITDSATVNSPGTRNVLNVPEVPTNAQELVARAMQGRLEAERLGQVDIGSSLSGFGDRVRGLKGKFGDTFANYQDPRSVEDLQATLDQISQVGNEKGAVFTEFVGDGQKGARTTTPAPLDIMRNTLHMNAGAEGKLAQALAMIEASRRDSVDLDANLDTRRNADFAEGFVERTNDGRLVGARSQPINFVAGQGGRPIPMQQVGTNTGMETYSRGGAPTAPFTADVLIRNESGLKPAVLGGMPEHDIARAGGNTKGAEGGNLQAQLARIQAGPQGEYTAEEVAQGLKDARSGQIGAVAGEGVGKLRYNQTKGMKSPEGGPVTGSELANREVKREIAFARKKGTNPSRSNVRNRIAQAEGPVLRQNEFEAERARRAADQSPPSRTLEDQAFVDSARQRAGEIESQRANEEVGKLIQLAKEGRQYDAPPMIVGGAGNERIVPGGRKGDAGNVNAAAVNLVGPSDQSIPRSPIQKEIEMMTGEKVRIQAGPGASVGLGGGNNRGGFFGDSVRPVQRIERASVPASVAPTPGAGTGSQTAPMVDAGGAGQQPPTSTAVAGGSAPKPRGMSPFEAQLARNAIEKRAGRERMRNRIGATAGGGLAALGGILGLANIGREEEVEEQY